MIIVIIISILVISLIIGAVFYMSGEKSKKCRLDNEHQIIEECLCGKEKCSKYCYKDNNGILGCHTYPNPCIDKDGNKKDIGQYAECDTTGHIQCKEGYDDDHKCNIKLEKC